MIKAMITALKPFLRLPIFLSEGLTYFSEVGTIVPTLAPAARAMCKDFYSDAGSARSILEVGAGTGPITEQIARGMRSEDKLVVCELNKSFMSHLRDKFHSDGVLASVAGSTSFVCDSVENIEGADRFDHIISSLPFSSFDADLLGSIFATYRRLLRPGGTLTYIEYAYLRTIFFSRLPKSSRRRQTHDFLEEILEAHQVQRDIVWANIPPVWIRSLKFG